MGVSTGLLEVGVRGARGYYREWGWRVKEAAGLSQSSYEAGVAVGGGPGVGGVASGAGVEAGGAVEVTTRV